MNHILVASPDVSILGQIADRMRAEGYVPHEAAEPMGVMLNAVACDLILLDEALDPDGALAGALRRDHPHLPLMVLARNTQTNDPTSSLDALQAAATALLRQTMFCPLPESIQTPHGLIDLDNQRLEDGTPLTDLETDLVTYLYTRRGRPVSRRELLAEVWAANELMQTRTVDVVIGKLRKKLERDPTGPALIVTVKNIGYAWV